MNTAYISEIYPTHQGEGPFTGERQLFVRLAGCPLRCRYCDTPGSLVAKAHEAVDGQKACERILQICCDEMIRTVSLTGGEPLAQVDFLKRLFPFLKRNQLRIYLETAGIHYEALSKVIEYCDVVAMDIKLPSATGQIFWNEHREFLKIGKEKIFVKIVIEKHSPELELKQALSLLKTLDSPPLLVLQQVTPQSSGIEPPSEDQMEEFVRFARALIPRVHVMSQQQKIWAIR
ncbi:hypothetical protein BVX98_00770 [bacterium F11]|nr:hypothetical protein BVX98_00770 [bacterium F11]